MAEIAILGYGTVGSGVVEVLKTNQLSIDKKACQPIRIKYILDLRDFPGDIMERKITHNFDDILNDDDVKIVVEVMGGVEPAYTFVKKALLRKKSVVTSNKELVAKHGAELLEIARENNINFLFEASVGGGIPIIRSLNNSLTADEITQIMGILNGTTNFILTKMTNEDREFDDVLKEAQDRGYAEKNPSADVDGHDTCRKIAILLSLAIGRHIDFEDIYTEGISKITKSDILYAKKMNSVIKLLAVAKIEEHQVFAKVAPVIINDNHPLSIVNDVFNAIFVKGNVIDEVMFYGRGAGKLPTASAVVSDIIDCAKHLNRNIINFWSNEKTTMLPIDDVKTIKLVRVKYNDKEKSINSIKNIFGNIEVVDIEHLENEYGFITPENTEKFIEEKISILTKSEGIENILNTIRLER